MIDVGDVVTLSVEVRDADNNLANAGTMTLTVTAPDGTVTGPTTIAPTSTGIYVATTTAAEGLHDVLWTATGANAGKHRDCFMAGPYLPLISIADAIDALGSGYVVTDAEALRDVIATASAVIERKRPIRKATKTITRSGGVGGRNALLLPWKPVQEILRVVESGATLTANDYVLDPHTATLHRGSTGMGTWAPGVANVTITAVVGYDAPPRAAIDACKAQVRHLWEKRRGGPNRGGQFGAGDGSNYLPPTRDLVTYEVAELIESIEPADDLPGFG